MTAKTLPGLFLRADTAAELMVANPVSLRADASLQEALILFTDRGISAAPVIDDAGQPVGVLSRSDILVHDREQAHYLKTQHDYFSDADLKTKEGERLKGFQVANVGQTLVRDLMTPAVFAVRPEAPAAKVVSEMVNLRVHRLFVVDDAGILVGVISTLDILKHLHK